jgi:hypothetical protein
MTRFRSRASDGQITFIVGGRATRRTDRSPSTYAPGRTPQAPAATACLRVGSAARSLPG